MSKRIWNLMYHCGKRVAVTANADNPLPRAQALQGAATIAGNGWKVWVEHADTGKRIFESPAQGRDGGTEAEAA